MHRRLGYTFAVLAMAIAMPLAAVRAADKSDKDAAAPSCHGVDMLAETAARDPQTYNRIMSEAAATKNAGAVFWKVEKQGRPASYLFGTVHLTDERAGT